MEFFRHQTDAGRGRSMTDAIEKFGHFGYAAWFLLLELYYEKLRTRDANHLRSCLRGAGLWFGFHPRVLRQHLRTTPAKLQQFLEYCQANGLLQFEWSHTTVEISICNLLELLDPKTRSVLSRIISESSGSLDEMRGNDPRGDESSVPSSEVVRDKPTRKPKKSNPKPGTDNSNAIAYFCDLWKTKYGVKTSPTITKKEAGIVKRFAESMGLEKTKEFMEAYFAMPDSWVIKQAHPITLLDTKKMEVHRFMQSGKFISGRDVRTIERKVANKTLFDKFEGGANGN